MKVPIISIKQYCLLIVLVTGLTRVVSAAGTVGLMPVDQKKMEAWMPKKIAGRTLDSGKSFNGLFTNATGSLELTIKDLIENRPDLIRLRNQFFQRQANSRVWVDVKGGAFLVISDAAYGRQAHGLIGDQLGVNIRMLNIKNGGGMLPTDEQPGVDEIVTVLNEIDFLSLAALVQRDTQAVQRCEFLTSLFPKQMGALQLDRLVSVELVQAHALYKSKDRRISYYVRVRDLDEAPKLKKEFLDQWKKFEKEATQQQRTGPPGGHAVWGEVNWVADCKVIGAVDGSPLILFGEKCLFCCINERYVIGISTLNNGLPREQLVEAFRAWDLKALGAKNVTVTK